MPPRCVAGRVDRPPPSLPIGVRALLRITVRGMLPSRYVRHASYSHDRRTPRHRRRHDRRRRLRGRGDRARSRRRAAGAGGLRRGEAGARKLAVTHAEAAATSSPGSAPRNDFDPEHARVVAAAVARPGEGDRRQVAVLGGPAPRLRRARRRRSSRARCSRRTPTGVQGGGDRRDRGADPLRAPRAEPGGRGRRVAEATNRARDLQNRPANVLTPPPWRSARRSSRACAWKCSTAPASRPRGWARSRPSRAAPKRSRG